jgi:PAS domain S-box-containing protein
MNTYTSSTVMEPSPTTTAIVELVSKYWTYALSILGALGIAWGYVKLVKGKAVQVYAVGAKCKVWVRAALDAPGLVAEIKQEIVLENGMSFRQWASKVDNSLESFRQLWVFERNRRHFLADSLSDPIFEMDRHGHMTYANKAFLELVKCDLIELLDRNWYNIIDLKDYDDVISGFAQSVALTSDFRTKFRLSLDDDEITVRMIATCLKDDNGVVIGYGGTLYEVSDARMYEAHEQGR